jgi:hypothetical protein
MSSDTHDRATDWIRFEPRLMQRSHPGLSSAASWPVFKRRATVDFRIDAIRRSRSTVCAMVDQEANDAIIKSHPARCPVDVTPRPIDRG